MTLFLRRYSNFLLRFGLAGVFIWFGYHSFATPDMFVKMVQAWTSFLGDAITLVKIHGAVEVIFGILLLIGWKTKLSAGILHLSLISTLISLSYGPTMVRALAIGFALLSLFSQS